MSYLKDWELIINNLKLLDVLPSEDIEDIKFNFNNSIAISYEKFEELNGSVDLNTTLNSLLVHYIDPYLQLKKLKSKYYKAAVLNILVHNRISLEFLLKGIYRQCLLLRNQDKDYIKFQEIVHSSINDIEYILEGIIGDERYYNYNPYRKLIELWLESFLKLQKFDFLDFTKSQDINIFYNQNHTKPNIEKNILEEKVIDKENNLPEIGARYYAIYHAIKISIGKKNPFIKTEKGYDKNEIVQYACDYYKVNKWKPIAFYNEFVQIDISNIHKSISPYRDWKKKVKSIADFLKDNDVINYLNHYSR